MHFSDDGGHDDLNGPPPPMNESWWAAVLQDESSSTGQDRRRYSSHQARNTASQSGSIEAWMWARELYESDDTVDLPVIGCNRGGLLVEAHELRGFVPISHLLSISPEADDDRRARMLGLLVGKTLCLKVIEYDPERGRLVFSERAAQAGPGRRLELLDSLSPGDHVRGKVTNVTRFGVFVDLGGVEGLIHVSELSWGRVRHPADVVACDDMVEVSVLSVDRDQGRIALSLKELLPDPWKTVEEQFKVGEIVEGIVTNVVKFGAFVGLRDGLEGLIHVSELGDGKFLHPRSVIEEGEKVRVRIIHIDANARRLGLSLRQVRQVDGDGPPPQAEEPAEQEALSSF